MEDLTPFANSDYQKEIAELKKQGTTNAAMADTTGRSYESVRSAVRNMRKRKGTPTYRENRKFTTHDMFSIISMIETQGVSVIDVADVMGCNETTIRKFMNKRSYKEFWDDYDEDSKPIASGQISPPERKRKKIDGKKFIFLAAQNNTHVHRDFMKSIENFAKHNDAQIIVSTFTYNKHGFQNQVKSDDDLWFDPAIKQYIVNEPIEICEDLVFCGELNILPTAVDPLSGLHSYTGGASGIVPHAKMQLESIPNHKSSDVKIMYTTGAVTQRNYIQKKAGQKAEFHHIYGAVYVEIDEEGDWFARQLSADSDTGCFYDLNRYYTPKEITDCAYVEAINWGDLHSEKKDHAVYEACFSGETTILDKLKPKYQFVHDVLDFTSRNHHNIGDPYFRFEKHIRGEDSVKGNIFDVIGTISSMTRDFSEIIIVESNHDLALEKWLKTADYKIDPENAIFFLECQLKKYKAIERGEDDFSIFEWAVKRNAEHLQHVRFLKTDESFRICDRDGEGIECGQHGHNGANGSRGGVGVFRRMGSRYNVGHCHSATIKDGVYYAGVMGKLSMGYNVGGGSWSHSLIVTYPNGKRTIITMKKSKDGKAKWRA